MKFAFKKTVINLGCALQRALMAIVGAGWRQAVLRVLVVGGFAGVIGFTAAWLGLIPVAASEGHWPITRWFLHFTMRHSVHTSALGIKAPSLDDEALILKGAGHYATGCAACHGSPGERPTLVPQQMTPKPPYLLPKIEEWSKEQLFWIVKHGVKYSAMPAWPSLQRDDEVWAMVAFLQQLPTLSQEQYQTLAYGPSTDSMNSTGVEQLDNPLQPVLQDCARCHGAYGQSRGRGAFPVLAGQREEYLFASLQAYTTGKRHSGIMQPVAAALSEDTQQSLARFYAAAGSARSGLNAAAQTRVTANSVVSEAIARGKRIAEQGVKELGVPECNSCHGPSKQKRNPLYPRLAGQHANYIQLQLSLFQKGSRGGTPYAHIMEQVAKRLTEQQMHDVAQFYASLSAHPVSDE